VISDTTWISNTSMNYSLQIEHLWGRFLMRENHFRIIGWKCDVQSVKNNRGRRNPDLHVAFVEASPRWPTRSGVSFYYRRHRGMFTFFVIPANAGIHRTLNMGIGFHRCDDWSIVRRGRYPQISSYRHVTVYPGSLFSSYRRTPVSIECLKWTPAPSIHHTGKIL